MFLPAHHTYLSHTMYSPLSPLFKSCTLVTVRRRKKKGGGACDGVATIATTPPELMLEPNVPPDLCSTLAPPVRVGEEKGKGSGGSR
jgi:hypothetical protein